jgi:hypothetical protein
VSKSPDTADARRGSAHQAVVAMAARADYKTGTMAARGVVIAIEGKLS